MLTYLTRYPVIQMNKEMREYCMKSTQDSIKRIVENNLERKNINTLIVDNVNKPNFNHYYFMIFLSITGITLYLNKRIM